ncbi:hypothetical protein GCM10008955_19990 [Deinococcus malanensis]|uniref:Uncharacterized protein n=1 Tax=Deinococcus malanensis TaxID=1706855 RepID=A0ABQ2EUJ7_9DEIO|nr:hypothetical protein GCM10008955_19990 [Deinococcus malanensis]
MVSVQGVQGMWRLVGRDVAQNQQGPLAGRSGPHVDRGQLVVSLAVAVFEPVGVPEQLQF